MSNIKRTLALIMAVFLILSSYFIAAYAQTTEGGVKVTITTDKEKYLIGQTATITVTAENNTGEDLRDAVIFVSSDKYKLAKSGGSNLLEIGSMKNGESKSLTIRCVLDRKAEGLTVFGRMYLFCRQLFSKPTDFVDESFDGKAGAHTFAYVRHGRVDVNLRASLYYTDPDFSGSDTLTGMFLASLKDSDQLSIKFTAISEEAFGAASGMPIELNIKGDKMSILFTISALKARFIMDGTTISMVFPAARAYYIAPEDSVEDLVQNLRDMDLSGMLTDENISYTETSSVKIDGKDYICETHSDITSNRELKFYFSGYTLKRIELIDLDSSQVQIMQIDAYSTSVSDDVFIIPDGYTKLSEEKFNSLLEGFGS